MFSEFVPNPFAERSCNKICLNHQWMGNISLKLIRLFYKLVSERKHNSHKSVIPWKSQV